MSNNKQSMKLYTEEQIKKVIKDSFLEGIERNTNYELVKKSIFDSLTPIELPSDEEIREERLLQFPDTEYTNRANDRLAFYCGAKFVINKIQGGNK